MVPDVECVWLIASMYKTFQSLEETKNKQLKLHFSSIFGSSATYLGAKAVLGAK
jgi:hypothetical protein